MLLLSYTAEKDNNVVTVSNRLMVSERTINNLLDTLVSNGFTILTTEIADGDDSQHWNG
jgi:DNA-binding IclR family transcriptional regulator